MKITAKEISNLVNGKLFAEPELIITGVAGIDEAGPQDISFVYNPKYFLKANDTKAGLLLVPEDFLSIEKPLIKVKNPQLAFSLVLDIIVKEKSQSFSPSIHPNAIISQTAKLGKNIFIGPNVVIEDNVSIDDDTKILANSFIGKDTNIGKKCIIYQMVTIREETLIGDNVIIHSGTVIGADGYGFIPDGDKGFHKIPQIGSVEIGNNVEIGANVTIDRATTGKTRIGSGTKIDNLVMIAHNVCIGKNCLIVAQAGIAGSTNIGNNVTIAAQAGLVGHITIGDGAVVAAQAGVIGSVKEKEIVSGYPARPHKEAMKTHALINKLPSIFEEIKKIKRS